MDSGAAPRPSVTFQHTDDGVQTRNNIKLSAGAGEDAVGRAVRDTGSTLRIVGEVAEAMQNKGPDDEWHSANREGLKFKLLKMSRMALVEAQDRYPEPKVPTVYIKDDDRHEPNPHDPDYLHALNDYVYQRNVLIINTCVALGTKLLECPTDVDKPDDTDWIEQLEVTGFVPPTNKWARYVAWVRLYALDGQEVIELINAVQRYNGFTREADVERAVDTFPGEQARDTDRTVQPETGSDVRDNDRDNAGASP